MGSSMKDIKLRIKSVESTMQITKAMELVASSKLRRAKEHAERTRPYFNTLHQTLADIAYFGDSINDRFILEAVGHPFAVNPSPALDALAEQRGWTKIKFA